MILLKLALKSLKNRWSTALLTIVSITLSIVLLLSVERTRRAAEDGFNSAVSKAHLLVGARTGPLNLILYTVFNMGNATNNISWESYQEIKNKPEIEWTIPYSLGDSHEGFRVVATDENFYEHYRFRGDQKVELKTGQPALGLWDVVIGSEVERKLKYQLGQNVVITHGVTKGKGIQDHSDKPFKVVGILRPTGTAIDQSIYISLYGMEAIHIDWKTGAAPTADQAIPQDQISKENIKIEAITAFFLRAKDQRQTLFLQRDINTYEQEPLLAIIPGATLSELWRGLSQINVVLQFISMMVLVIGIASMVSSLLASLNERRREMSILRSIGAKVSSISILLVLETSVLTLISIILGLGIQLGGFFVLADWIQSEFGFYIVGDPITRSELIYLLMIFVVGVLAGLIPAYKAKKMALKDGLTVKV